MEKLQQYGDIIDNYVMLTAFNIAGLKNLGIQESVLKRLQTKRFADIENETWKLDEIKSVENMELFFDLYIGTILNSIYSKDEIIKYIFELELPAEFEQISCLFQEQEVIFRLNDLYFSSKLSQYNQLLLSYLGKFQPSNDTVCFNITTKS